MSNLLDLARATGAFALPMLLLILVGLGAAPLLAVVGASRRLPVMSWLLAPTLCAIFGGLSVLMGGRHILAALEYVAPSSRGMIAAVGLSELLSGLVLGFGGAAMILVWSGLWAAVGSNLGAGPEARWRAGVATLLGGLCGLGAGLLYLLAARASPEAGAGPLCLLLAGGGLALGISGSRAAPGPREASSRMIVSAAALAVLALGAGLAATTAARASEILMETTRGGDLYTVRAALRAAVLAFDHGLKLGGALLATMVIAAALRVASHLRHARIAGLLPELLLAGGVAGVMIAAGVPGLLMARAVWPHTAAGRYQIVASKVQDLPLLPHEKDMPHPAPAGHWEGTLVIREGDRWLREDDAGWVPLDEPTEDEPLILALSASLPAKVLLETPWRGAAEDASGLAAPAALRVVARSDVSREIHGRYAELLVAAEVQGVELVIGPAGPLQGAGASWASRWVTESAAPLVVSGVAGETRDGLVLSPDAQGLSQLVARVRAGEFSSFYFVPDQTWTVQDLVTLCATARGVAHFEHGQEPDCLVGPAPGPEGMLTAPLAQGGVQLGDDLIVMGALSEAAVRAVVAGSQPQLAACVEGEEALSGEVVVKLLIDKEGLVSRSEVKRSTLDRPDLERCLVDTFLEMAFEPPKAGGIAIVSYPLVIETR